MDFENPIRHQYERFPYPSISFFALPKRNQGQGLRYELGTQLAQGQEKSHRGIRILVAGAGTLEALVVAQIHPWAKELVAFELSQSSLDHLERRIRLARIARFPLQIPPIRLVCGDLHHDLKAEPPFDYVIASNVIHHSPDPPKLLRTLSLYLRPGGLIRLVTYPKSSRIWMRQTSLWLRSHGITSSTPHLLSKCRSLIRLLPSQHPIRLCNESCPEAKTQIGIVDAWLNACENPLSPLEWKVAAQNASLRRIGETQTDTSRSSFLDEILPELQNLDFWDKLQIMDDLLEICANPVLWFEREARDTIATPPLSLAEEQTSRNAPQALEREFMIPSRIHWEMKQGLLRIQKILQNSDSGIGLQHLVRRFQEEVGPRVDPKNPEKILPGLAITDYSLSEILATQQPWDASVWEKLQIQVGHNAQLTASNLDESSRGSPQSWIDQESLLQLEYGHTSNSIRVRIAMA